MNSFKISKPYRNKVLLVGFLIVCSLFLVSCKDNSLDFKESTNIIVNEEKVIENIEDFQKKYSKLLDDGDILEAIEVLDSNITSFDKIEASKAVEALMHYLYYYNFAEDNEFYKLLNYANENKITENNIDTFFISEDNNEISHLYNVFKENLYVIKVDKEESFVNELGLSYIEINNDEIINKYGNYIANDLFNLINLYKSEELYIYDDINDIVNLDKALFNIIQMENFISSNPNSTYVNEVNQNLDYQYQAYFGYLEWSNIFDENGLIKDVAKNHYIQTAKIYNEGTIGEKASEYIKMLEKENFSRTANIEVFLLDLTNVEYESISE